MLCKSEIECTKWLKQPGGQNYFSSHNETSIYYYKLLIINILINKVLRLINQTLID